MKFKKAILIILILHCMLDSNAQSADRYNPIKLFFFKVYSCF